MTDRAKRNLNGGWRRDWRAVFLVVLVCFATAVPATQVNPPYSWDIAQAKKASKAQPQTAVYIWPWVKSPGAYPYTNGMSVAALVSAAGGLITDARYIDHPVLRHLAYPQTIYVKRPTSEDPDPTTSTYRYSLDWSKPEANVTNCTYMLHEGDFVGISMSKSVP